MKEVKELTGNRTHRLAAQVLKAEVFSLLTQMKSDDSEIPSDTCFLKATAMPAKFTTPTFETIPKRQLCLHNQKLGRMLNSMFQKDDYNPANLFLP